MARSRVESTEVDALLDSQQRRRNAPMTKITLKIWPLAALLLLAASARAQTVSDPYSQGMRWSYGSTAVSPWIPRDVALVADGEFAWVGEAVGNPAVTLLGGTNAATLQTVFSFPQIGALNIVDVEAGDCIDELYAAAQFAGSTPSAGRKTEVSRFSGFQSSQPLLWTRTLGPDVVGGVLLAVDSTGEAVVAARFDPKVGRVDLDRLSPADGSSDFSVSFAAGSLRGLAISKGGDRILVALGGAFLLLDGAGNILLQQSLPSSTEAFAISADGSTLALGDLGKLHIFTESATGYSETQNLVVTSEWMTTRIALSSDGSELAAGWWNYQTGLSIRFQMWDLSTSSKLHEFTQSGLGGGLQNFPQDIAISPNGNRAVLGAWGSGGPEPQLVLLDRNEPLPVFSTYLAGSVMALDMDDTGDRITVAMKGSHSNQFATTGYVQSFATGQRDLQIVGQTLIGAPFQFTSMQAGSTGTLLVFGSPMSYGSPPITINGVLGELKIDPSQAFIMQGLLADAFGRADLVGVIPSSASLIGMAIAVQAVFVTPFGLEFSAATRLPTIL